MNSISWVNALGKNELPIQKQAHNGRLDPVARSTLCVQVMHWPEITSLLIFFNSKNKNPVSVKAQSKRISP